MPRKPALLAAFCRAGGVAMWHVPRKHRGRVACAKRTRCSCGTCYTAPCTCSVAHKGARTMVKNTHERNFGLPETASRRLGRTQTPFL
eukprot:14554598-Alexandrium_andersonii.AAC.1